MHGGVEVGAVAIIGAVGTLTQQAIWGDTQSGEKPQEQGGSGGSHPSIESHPTESPLTHGVHMGGDSLLWHKVAHITFQRWGWVGGFSDLSGPTLKISEWVAIIMIKLNPAITQFGLSPHNQNWGTSCLFYSNIF